MNLGEIAKGFLKIGATGFGGPMALLGLIEEQIVRRSPELTEEDFVEGVALSQMLPGPLAVDCAAYLGYRLRGIWGALLSTGALILPAFIMMLIVTPLYLKHGRLPALEAFFFGVAPAVIAVIFWTGFRLGTQFITHYAAGAIAAFVAIAAYCGFSPIWLIIGSGLAGMLWRSRSSYKETEAQDG